MDATREGSDDAALAHLTVKFGLWGLVCYVTLGLGLEALHGFKAAFYLEYETRRLLWTLAHAHGVLLSMLTVGFGMLLHLRGDGGARWPRIAAGCLMAAVVLLPGGFLLGGTWIFAGDPGPGVALAPVGGALLLVGVLLTAIHYRAR
jgi:hypothetical protein